MTVDRELVTRKLLLITRDLEGVAPLVTKPLSAFLENRSIRRWSSGCWNG